ncbi:MAG: hypothetical protein FWB86_08815 [Treponema sp.]|nr:hypothetical protein [Treponema sp.]MCL2251397.1 hypothetical protein [Treponema sp.]
MHTNKVCAGFKFSLCLFLLILLLAMQTGKASSQEITRAARGSIPEALLRPNRSEAPRYPIDTVIGELGRGEAPEGGYVFANSICEGLVSGEMSHRALSSISASIRESYLSSIEIINPLSYRIGGGREEADGAISFLVRFIGREQGITGELFIRLIREVIKNEDDTSEEDRTRTYWRFDELLLEEVKDKETELKESIYLNDFNPYERFF